MRRHAHGFFLALLATWLALPALAQTQYLGGGGTGGAGEGTVTSVALSAPAQFTVTGSPVSTFGTLNLAWASAAQGTVFAGPCSGAGTPVFRALCAADIPAIAQSQVTNLATDLAAKVPTTRTITAGANLSGGGDLSANRSFALATTITGLTSVSSTAFVGDLTGNVTGNVSGSSGSTTGNAATATALAANGTNCSAGNYPLGVDASGNAENCTAVSAGSGDVVGPASATNNALARFDGTTGKLLADSGVLLDSNGNLSGATNVLTIKSSTSPQGFRLYNTDDGAGNSEWLESQWASNYAYLRTQKTGSGTQRGMVIDFGAGNMYVKREGVDIFYVNAGGVEPLNASSLGAPTGQWKYAYVSHAIQGGSVKTLTDATATGFATVSIASNSTAAGEVVYAVETADASNELQIEHGRIPFVATNKGGTITVAFGTKANDLQSVTAGTLAVTFDATTGTNAFTLRVTSDTSLTTTVHRITWRMGLPVPATVTSL